MTIKTYCPNLACEAEIEVDYTPGEPAKTYGPPERCHDGSADEFSPDKCPECGAALDEAKIEAQAAEDAEDAQTEREISKAEWREHSRRSEFGGRDY